MQWLRLRAVVAPGSEENSEPVLENPPSMKSQSGKIRYALLELLDLLDLLRGTFRFSQTPELWGIERR